MEILNDKNIEFKTIEYLKSGLTVNQLKSIAKKLDLPPQDIMRQKDKLYKELQIEKITDDDKLIELLSKNIKLLERPIIIKDNKAVIGRPPEKINELLF